MRGCAREIVVVNRDRKRAKGVATDLRYGAALSPTVHIHDGDYADLTGAALVIVTAGVNEESRRRRPTAAIRQAGFGSFTRMLRYTVR